LLDELMMGLIVAGLLGTLIFTRVAPTWAFSGAMLVTYFAGLIDADVVLEKAGNQGLVTLILLMLVSVGLERLPWLAVLSAQLVRPSLRRTLLRLSAITVAFSALLNNTAVVATLAGVLRKNRLHPASHLLLPLSYAAILGGTLTLIGTSTNLIVSSFYQDVTGSGLGFFTFLPVGAAAVVTGVGTMLLFSRWLPDHGRDELQLEDYLIEAEVLPHSKLIGRSIQENGLRDLGDIFLVEIAREDQLLTAVSPTQHIEAGDKLIFSGDVSKVGLLERFHGLKTFASAEGLLTANLTEVVVMPNASVAGQTIKDTGFRSRFDAAVVGLRRDGEQLSGKLGVIELQPGDSLMLAVGPDFHSRSNLRKNFLVIDSSIGASRLPLGVSVFITSVLVAVIVLSAMGVLSLLKGLAFLLLSMLLLKVCKPNELRRRFPFEMWLIISSALTVSQGMTDTGAVDALVEGLTPLLADTSPWLAVAAVYFLTLLMTELMTNNAAAALVFPLAYSLALVSGSDPMPFVMAVAFGASASFVTPFGYTTNLMVQNLGGYRRLDYIRFGTPVSLAYSASVAVFLPLAFPL
jgi:di/tricarboxylate transporter